MYPAFENKQDFLETVKRSQTYVYDANHLESEVEDFIEKYVKIWWSEGGYGHMEVEYIDDVICNIEESIEESKDTFSAKVTHSWYVCPDYSDERVMEYDIPVKYLWTENWDESAKKDRIRRKKQEEIQKEIDKRRDKYEELVRCEEYLRENADEYKALKKEFGNG